MVTIKLFGDRTDDGAFEWSIECTDSRGTVLETNGVDESEGDAKACIMAAIGPLVNSLQFVPVVLARRDNSRR